MPSPKMRGPGEWTRADRPVPEVLELKGWLANESLLNRLGYQLLSSWQMVVAVFKLNRELHPRSANVHASPGFASVGQLGWGEVRLEDRNGGL